MSNFSSYSSLDSNYYAPDGIETEKDINSNMPSSYITRILSNQAMSNFSSLEKDLHVKDEITGKSSNSNHCTPDGIETKKDINSSTSSFDVTRILSNQNMLNFSSSDEGLDAKDFMVPGGSPYRREINASSGASVLGSSTSWRPSIVPLPNFTEPSNRARNVYSTPSHSSISLNQSPSERYNKRNSGFMNSMKGMFCMLGLKDSPQGGFYKNISQETIQVEQSDIGVTHRMSEFGARKSTQATPRERETIMRGCDQEERKNDNSSRNLTEIYKNEKVLELRGSVGNVFTGVVKLNNTYAVIGQKENLSNEDKRTETTIGSKKMDSVHEDEPNIEPKTLNSLNGVNMQENSSNDNETTESIMETTTGLSKTKELYKNEAHNVSKYAARTLNYIEATNKKWSQTLYYIAPYQRTNVQINIEHDKREYGIKLLDKSPQELKLQQEHVVYVTVINTTRNQVKIGDQDGLPHVLPSYLNKVLDKPVGDTIHEQEESRDLEHLFDYDQEKTRPSFDQETSNANIFTLPPDYPQCTKVTSEKLSPRGKVGTFQLFTIVLPRPSTSIQVRSTVSGSPEYDLHGNMTYTALDSQGTQFRSTITVHMRKQTKILRYITFTDSTI